MKLRTHCSVTIPIKNTFWRGVYLLTPPFHQQRPRLKQSMRIFRSLTIFFFTWQELHCYLVHSNWNKQKNNRDHVHIALQYCDIHVVFSFFWFWPWSYRQSYSVEMCVCVCVAVCASSKSIFISHSSIEKLNCSFWWGAERKRDWALWTRICRYQMLVNDWKMERLSFFCLDFSRNPCIIPLLTTAARGVHLFHQRRFLLKLILVFFVYEYSLFGWQYVCVCDDDACAMDKFSIWHWSVQIT